MDFLENIPVKILLFEMQNIPKESGVCRVRVSDKNKIKNKNNIYVSSASLDKYCLQNENSFVMRDYSMEVKNKRVL